MGYTALRRMQQINEERFGRDVGPEQPEMYAGGEGTGTDMKGAALRFLHERCEGLCFDPEKESEDPVCCSGTSVLPGQIPFNMQMDLNRLCLQRELETFIDSGSAEDAYNIYYCYLEMFFGHYGKSKKMVELLSEFEENGSSLLMKHRDHYSHSVYVFALGLAVYETNPAFREAFGAFYGLEDERKAAHAFLEYWGLSSLFHDIGYPFELPFEQVLSYFEVDGQDRGKGSVFLAYGDVDALTGLDAKAEERFRELYGKTFRDTNGLFAHAVEETLGEAYGIDAAQLERVIARKPKEPDSFGYFMDHAWFSAARLLQELLETFGAEGIGRPHIDALTAILMHNSLYKFAISFYKDPDRRKGPLKMEQHPLAFLLMLCDELQCWDRTAYGRNSRKELHPMGADFDFSDHSIRAVYYYDAEEHEKIERFRKEYRKWENSGEAGDPPRLKAFSDMAEKEQRFVRDIEKIVDTGNIPLTVIPDIRPVDRGSKHTYLSSSNFLHLYDFAVALNARYNYEEGIRDTDPSGEDTEKIEEEFESLSLEYQLSNINQAKSFSRYLNAIGCFYTDRPVDFDMVTEFTPEQTAVFAPMEHERWIREHRAMAWREGDFYEDAACPPDLPLEKRAGWGKTLREQTRTHKLAMDGELTEEAIRRHYEELPEEEQGKDWKPFNNMLRLIKKYDGLRIYRL